MQSHSAKVNPALDAAIGTVRTAINKTPNSTLAIMYREIAQTTHDSALNDEIRKHWADTIEVLAISSDDEIAIELKSWIEKTIATGEPKTVKDFLGNVLNGIVIVSRRS